MAIFRTADRIFALRFLRLLTTPWKKTGAYKAGIIDDKGRKIRKPKSGKEKDVYNLFHKLVFNIKRLLNKIPFGKTTIASYAAALYLIKEHTGLSDKILGECLLEVTGYNPYNDADKIEVSLQENQLIMENVLFETGELAFSRGMEIKLESKPKHVGTIFGYEIIEGIHASTNQKVYVCRGKPKE